MIEIAIVNPVAVAGESLFVSSSEFGRKVKNRPIKICVNDSSWNEVAKELIDKYK